MKFEIQTVGNWDDPVEILDEYPCLEKYDLKVLELPRKRYVRIKDENGRSIKQIEPYTITRMTVSIESLEQLLGLINEIDEPIIVQKLDEKHADFNIEIYDGYRE